jgi:hypothetical protein
LITLLDAFILFENITTTAAAVLKPAAREPRRERSSDRW